MSSALHDVMQSCRDTLAVTIPMETYVYASPQFNAICIKPEEGRLFVAISSSLLDQIANALEIPQGIRESLLHPHIEEHRNPTK